MAKAPERPPRRPRLSFAFSRGVRMFCAGAELTSVERAMARPHTASRGRRDEQRPTPVGR